MSLGILGEIGGMLKKLGIAVDKLNETLDHKNNYFWESYIIRKIITGETHYIIRQTLGNVLIVIGIWWLNILNLALGVQQISVMKG